MVFDYSKLKGKIKEVFDTQDAFARAMKVSNTTMVSKLSSASNWTQTQILKACVLLRIEQAEIPAYFFNRKS